MNTDSNIFKFRLGLFVLIGFLLFVVAIFIIGRQKNLFNPVYRLSTSFYNVSGLQVGNNIRFCGINAGTVANLKIINDSTIMVDMLIDKAYDGLIKNDSRVAISSDGLIGDKILVIHKGSMSAPFAKEGFILSSWEPVETDAILESVAVSAANAEIITEQLAEILIKINKGKGTLGRLIQDESMADNINKTIKNLKTSAEGLSENMVAVRSNFFLKGFFKKKEKIAEDKKKEREKKILEDAKQKNKAKEKK